jgi:hypothetical protein
MACRGLYFPLYARYSAVAARRKAPAVLAFIRIMPGKPVINGSMPKIHPAITAVAITVTTPVASTGIDFVGNCRIEMSGCNPLPILSALHSGP